MEDIKAYFEKMVPLSDQDWQVFSSRLVKRAFPKKSVILKVGQTETHLSFIEKGMVRLYIPKEENDLTFGFTFQNEFVSAYDSFITQTPCSYQVQALADTVLWSVSYQDLQYIYKHSSAGNRIGRYAAENLFLIKTRRELSLLNESAEERYQKLFEERPQLIRQIPLKYIASYIGITPQALSRIRARIS